MTGSIGDLSDVELGIIRQTQPVELARLDEEELLELHTRVRRARNKYVGQYRRGATGRVVEAGARGAARTRSQRARERAEVFEAALARVSQALAKAARRSAAELKAERLAAAMAARPARPTAPTRPKPSAAIAKKPKAAKKSPARIKREASTRATGARRQAKRDAR